METFFVSYTSHDRTWAEWIAWTLEEAGHSVIIQDWDFRPGGNFVLNMQRAMQKSDRTIAVLSPHFLQAEYTQSEWASAFAQDPQSIKRKLIPVRVADCKPDGLLKSIAYVDLVGCSQVEATEKLRQMLHDRAKPSQAPAFPGIGNVHHDASIAPDFPGDRNLDTPAPATSVSLGIYGWDGPQTDPPPMVERDWRRYCDRDSRTVPTPELWETELFADLKQAKQDLAERSTCRAIELSGNRPLTMTLAIGATFPAVAGYQLRLQQFTDNQPALWHLAQPSEARLRVRQQQGAPGDDLLFAINISIPTGENFINPAWEEIQEFYTDHPDQFTGLVYVEPEAGAGQNALQSGGDALALALHAKELIRQYRRKYKAQLLHLILACPAGFALSLGQQLNAVGKIMAYERTENGSYQASVCLRTG
ncbi:TIR domain-containing protein [Nodosilinea sp. P-1105]|uniref:TIR domain-containing protein n=1 Tax=Nodosilinea sp. P-1105 TaxID=2546229 RepID=UPI00146CB8AF|nr:TIR domain-containing protein [Nodosilinea sp. P-1105]NMF84114.1 toll/interleukin-1 receptor domain-containing protein [Nodosilinea sp. P-1105]